MAAGIRRYRTPLLVVVISVLVASGVMAVQAAETPRRGGVLLAVLGADPPSLDPHQEQTFATLQLVAPLYSTLLQTDPYSYPKIIGDAATEWTIAPDGLTYTFTGASLNWGRFSDPAIDDLFSRQARTIDPAERRRLVIELQKMVLANAYYMPGLWWRRNVVHWAKVKNYVAPPSHFTNQKLQDVWLAED